MLRRYKCQIKIVLAFVALALLCTLTGFAEHVEKHSLSSLRILNRVVLLMRENYVKPERFDPPKMLIAALDAVEQKVPEVVAYEPKGDKITIQVGKKTKSFSIKDIGSLWDLSFKLREIFRFVEPNLGHEVDLAEVEYAAVNGMLGTLDPYSVLFEPKQSQEMKVSTKGEFGGLGIVIAVKDGKLIVLNAIEGSPAGIAGMKPLDNITKIAKDATINMALAQAATLLRGPPGSAVQLTVKRRGENKERVFNLVREIIKVDTTTSKLFDGGVGYVKVKAFHSNTVKEIRASQEKLVEQNGGALKGLILDLRGNPGGLLEQAVEVSSEFLDGGPIVATQGAEPDDREEENATPGPQKTHLPLVVLADGNSASASEIVAGALKARGRALVIGEQTFGKGSVQLLYDFPGGAALKMTIAQYLTPGDVSIQSIGITPDFALHPVGISSNAQFNLFANKRGREDKNPSIGDGKINVATKPLFEMDYLLPEPVQKSKKEASKSKNHDEQAEDADEKNAIDDLTEDEEAAVAAADDKVKEDFDIDFAKRILQKASGPSRENLLAVGGAVFAKAKEEQDQELVTLLRKMGIDWSPPVSLAGGTKLKARVVSAKPVKAGEEFVLTVAVKNEGGVAVHRLYGSTQATAGIFDDLELIYGAILPGQERSATVKVKVPKGEKTRRDEVRISLWGNQEEPFGNIDIPVVTMGRESPILAHAYFVDTEEKVIPGKEPSVEQRVNWVVLVKNVGKGVAESPTVVLKNNGASEIFIHEGRQHLPELKPGEIGIAKFSYEHRQTDVPAKLELQLYDDVSGDYWTDKMEVPHIGKYSKLDAALNEYVITKPAHLQLIPKEHAEELMQLNAGDVCTILGKQDRFALVRVNHFATGFLPVDALESASRKSSDEQAEMFDPGSKTVKEGTKKLWPRLLSKRQPPLLELGSDKQPIVAKGHYKLRLKISSESTLLDAFLFVGPKKVFYESFAGTGPTKQDIETDVALSPGVNRLICVARKNDSYANRRIIFVYSDQGDPFEPEDTL
jgi:carboxyl-terminal processing protease